MGCFLMGKPGRVWAGEWVHGVVHGWMHVKGCFKCSVILPGLGGV